MAKHLVPRRPWIPEVEEWVVREYAHQARKDRKPGDRVDFQETVYWSANLRPTRAQAGGKSPSNCPTRLAHSR